MINLRGVYRILCTKNNMSYIGHTSTSFLKRWKTHVKDLSRGTHHCNLLQNDWNQYGSNEFVFKVLNIEDDKTKSLEIEQSYINGMKDGIYNTSLNNGFAKQIYIRSFDNTKIEVAKSIPTIIRRRNGIDTFLKKKSKREYVSDTKFDVWKWGGSSFVLISSEDVIFTKNNFDGIELLFDFDTGFFDTKTKEEKISLNIGLATDFATKGDLAILRPINKNETYKILKIIDKSNGRILLSNDKWVLPDLVQSIECIYDAEFWP